MGSYRVLFPVGFATSTGAAMSCTTVGAVVDVDDELAVRLVSEGKLEPVEDDPEPEQPAEPEPEPEPRTPRATRAKAKVES